MMSSQLAFHLRRWKDSITLTHEKQDNFTGYCKIKTVAEIIKRHTNNENCKSFKLDLD